MGVIEVIEVIGVIGVIGVIKVIGVIDFYESWLNVTLQFIKIFVVIRVI